MRGQKGELHGDIPSPSAQSLVREKLLCSSSVPWVRKPQVMAGEEEAVGLFLFFIWVPPLPLVVEAVVVTCLLTYPPSLCFRLLRCHFHAYTGALVPASALFQPSVRVWLWANQGTYGSRLSGHLCCPGAMSWVPLTLCTCKMGVPSQGPSLHSLRAVAVVAFVVLACPLVSAAGPRSSLRTERKHRRKRNSVELRHEAPN